MRSHTMESTSVNRLLIVSLMIAIAFRDWGEVMVNIGHSSTAYVRNPTKGCFDSSD